MHPLFRQVPPITPFSQTATSAPSSVAFMAAEKAAEPPPIIMISNLKFAFIVFPLAFFLPEKGVCGYAEEYHKSRH